MRAIARRVELTDPALYYHFHSKRELLAAIVDTSPVEPLATVRCPAPVTRDAVVDAIVDNFFSWTVGHEMVRMLLRQQLLRDEGSVEFRRQANEAFFARYGPPLRALYGSQADLFLEALSLLLAGVLWTAILRHADRLDEVFAQDYFRRRVHRLVSTVLPVAPAGASSGFHS